jgi:hypothetical protein
MLLSVLVVSTIKRGNLSRRLSRHTITDYLSLDPLTQH